MGRESVAVIRSARQHNMCLLAVLFVALTEISMTFPKNFVCPSVIGLVTPLDKAMPFERSLVPSKRNETHLVGV